MSSADITASGKSRRALVKTAAWSIPAIAAAIAAPAASASSDGSRYSVTATCGTAGNPGPSFILTAGSMDPLPVGSVFYIDAFEIDGVIESFATSGGALITRFTSDTGAEYILAADLPPGTSIEFKMTISSGASYEIVAFVDPSGVPDQNYPTQAWVIGSNGECSFSNYP